MRIGIVTQTLANNYGGILQNYALQQCLKKLGHEPITIDFKRPPLDYPTYLLLFIKAVIAFFIPSKRRPLPKRDINRRTEKNESFVNKNISKTRLVEKYSADLIDEYQLDAIIVGSDQVWRPEYNYCLEDMFLMFAGKSDIVKIAYAASFGVDQWEFTEEQTKLCQDLCQGFQSISVRENSGIELCKKYLNVDAVEMVDPTLLLVKEEYEHLCKDVPATDGKFLAAYILDLTPEKRNFINNIAKEHGLKPIIFRADLSGSLTIEEWISMFRDAQYVVTDSFHGTVFSIIFNKPFLSITNKFRGGSRFYSLLEKFSLTDRVVDTFTTSPALKEIDWEDVNKIICNLRNSAYSYLTSNLICL